MTKVLGTKVSDDVYDRFAALEGNISDNLRIAIQMYMDYHDGKPLTDVNKQMFDNAYRELTKLIDKHLDRLEGF